MASSSSPTPGGRKRFVNLPRPLAGFPPESGSETDNEGRPLGAPSRRRRTNMRSTFPTLLNCRSCLPYTGLLLVTVISATEVSALSIPQRISDHSRGNHVAASVCSRPAVYLVTVGAIPFRLAAPPPEPVERPLPPIAISSPSPAAVPADIVPTTTPTATVPDVVAAETPSPAQPAPAKSIPILPDDTPRELRVEDVLPYFQLPKQEAPDRGDSGMKQSFVPSRPDTLPPSSATYQLK